MQQILLASGKQFAAQGELVTKTGRGKKSKCKMCVTSGQYLAVTIHIDIYGKDLARFYPRQTKSEDKLRLERAGFRSGRTQLRRIQKVIISPAILHLLWDFERE